MRRQCLQVCSPQLPLPWSSWGCRSPALKLRSMWSGVWNFCGDISRRMANFRRAMVLKSDVYPIVSGDDVVRVRQVARQWATELKFSLVDQTKLVTATSELARNTLEHGKGGRMKAELVENGSRKGVRLAF